MSDTVTGAVHTAGPWDIYKHPVSNADDAKAELAFQVDNTTPLGAHLYLVNANGKCPALTGCGPTSEANARLIVAACNSYDRHFGPSAVSAAEGDLLGLALEALRKVKPLLFDHVQIAKNLNDEAGEDTAVELSEQIDAILSQAQAREVTR